MAFSDWLRYSLSILMQIVGSLEVCAGCRFFAFSKFLWRGFRL